MAFSLIAEPNVLVELKININKCTLIGVFLSFFVSTVYFLLLKGELQHRHCRVLCYYVVLSDAK